MRPNRLSLPEPDRRRLLELLTRLGIDQERAGKAINSLSWLSIFPGEELDFLAGERDEDVARDERELLVDVDRVCRAIRRQADEGIEWFNQRHSNQWYARKLLPVLAELKADTLQAIASWEDQEARRSEYEAEVRASRSRSKPRKIMVLAEAAAGVWVRDLGLEPRRSKAFREFLNLVTEGARQELGLGEITDRQLERLVPRLRARHDVPGLPGRPKKTPPK